MYISLCFFGLVCLPSMLSAIWLLIRRIFVIARCLFSRGSTVDHGDSKPWSSWWIFFRDFLFGNDQCGRWNLSMLVYWRVPSGKPTKSYGKSPFIIGRSTINGPISIVMLVYRMVNHVDPIDLLGRDIAEPAGSLVLSQHLVYQYVDETQ